MKMSENSISPSPREAERLSELREFCILDTPSEEDFDGLTALAAYICEAPMAMISLVDEDRQWFKSKVGLDVLETARHIAFCTHTIAQEDVLVVPDVSLDKRFADNPFVTSAPYIRFYAGAPLLTSGGHALGSLCILDTVPRELKPDHKLALRVLSRQIVAQLELRRSDAKRRAAEAALKRANDGLRRSLEERTVEIRKARAEADAARHDITEMIERVSDGLVALDTDWHYTYVNQKAAELLGRRPEELLGKHIWTEFPEGVGQPFHKAYCRAVAEQKPVILQAYYEPWGRWFENRIHPSKNGVSIFFQEVTEQKRMQEHLEREKHLSDTVIACLPGLFYLFDEQGRYLRWNKRTEEITGLSAEELAGKHPLEVIAPADRATTKAGIAQVFAEGESTTEARILSKDGTETWHLCSGKRITVDGKRCLVGLAIDISEQKRAEAQLREAQTRLELAVRTSGLGLWDWDIVHDRAFVSPEWKSRFDFDESELTDAFSLWKSRLHPEDREAAVARLEAFLAGSTPEYHSEARVRGNDGVYRWVSSRAQLLRDDHGRPLRMLGCHFDITKHRETEERLLQQREQLRALAQHLNSVREEEAGRIARELHDELGAALTGLKIDVNRLGQRLGKETFEIKRAQIQTILSSIDATIRSVRKICLDLRPAVLDQLGLSAAVEWLVAEFQKRTKIACELRQPESMSLQAECATTVFRILQELLTNIIRHAEATRVSINLRIEPETLVLEVQDNGRGLPEEALTRHDRFGLLGVRERVVALGGKVEFDGKRNSGTRVVVQVPLE